MAGTERSLSELLQAAQHMTNKADMGKQSTASSGVSSMYSAAAFTPTVDDLPKVDRSLAQLVQVSWSDIGKKLTDKS